MPKFYLHPLCVSDDLMAETLSYDSTKPQTLAERLHKAFNKQTRAARQIWAAKEILEALEAEGFDLVEIDVTYNGNLGCLIVDCDEGTIEKIQSMRIPSLDKIMPFEGSGDMWYAGTEYESPEANI